MYCFQGTNNRVDIAHMLIDERRRKLIDRERPDIYHNLYIFKTFKFRNSWHEGDRQAMMIDHHYNNYRYCTVVSYLRFLPSDSLLGVILHTVRRHQRDTFINE